MTYTHHAWVPDANQLETYSFSPPTQIYLFMIHFQSFQLSVSDYQWCCSKELMGVSLFPECLEVCLSVPPLSGTRMTLVLVSDYMKAPEIQLCDG